ncbi:MAG TPA: cytochrome C oxidase subunit IV family protein [Fimbriimonadales bacterium]|jgi:cytochrome c oxidase subunit 4|nr:cytochrome C oxidase subunit IV family protein [Fimbriimonadales bacterium]
MSAEQHSAVPIRIYFNVFLTLLVLLVITVWVAYMDLGFLNTVVAMAIAVVKALLVILYFMDMRRGAHLAQIWAGGGVIFLLTLFCLSLGDYLSRLVF